MVKSEVMIKIMKCFPGSYINGLGEFIASDLGNEYFNIMKCHDELEIKCKVIEWFSRAAFKDAPSTPRKNKQLHEFMLTGINAYLGTSFTEEDMEKIYCPIGNECNRGLCIKFIESGYDMRLLESEV